MGKKYVVYGMSVSSTIHDTPSGNRYVINDGVPFEVLNKEDEEYFNKNPTFEIYTPAVDEKIEAAKKEKEARKKPKKPR